VSKRRGPVRLGEGFGAFERCVLLLQGGGALGAYQAGVYEGLAAVGVTPDWIVGVSIGAINAALIAGNPPERRVERLHEFWDRISAQTTYARPDFVGGIRPFFNGLSAASSVMFGVPGFFSPRVPPPFLAPEGTMGALSYYDTTPLKETLEELVDFDLINEGEVRLSLGAVQIRTGNSIYFDNERMKIGSEHVMASGALPPGFPPIRIDGELYWDGGLVSNTPLWYVMDEDYRINALIFQVDLFPAAGEAPGTMAEVAERAKDIQFSSRTRFNATRVKEMEALRGALSRLLDKLPAALRKDDDVKRLAAVGTRGAVALVHLINRHSRPSEFKDYEFSRATVNDLWEGGRNDVEGCVTHPRWREAIDIGEGVSVFDWTRAK
jgi:NTE family protein